MRHVFPLLLLLTLAPLAGCELVGDTGEDGVDYAAIREIRFSRHVQPLLQDKFAPLLADETGLRLDSWEHLMQGSDFGEVVIPFDAENSLLLELATRLTPPHPSQLGPDSLTQEEVAFVARWIDEGARNDAGDVPYADAAHRLYVANQDDALISIIDTEANVVIRTVKLADYGFPVESRPKPHDIAVAPDGSFWYVSLIGANTVLRFNRDNELVGRSDFFETPGMVELSPDGDVVYAGRSLSAVDPPRSIAAIRTADMVLEPIDVVYEKPHALKVAPDGRTLYSGSLVTNQVAAVDAATHAVHLVTVPGPQQAYLHFAVSPDSRTLYATGQVAGQLQVFELSEPLLPTLVATLDVEAGPWHPVLSPDGRRLYFGNKAANAITVVDTQARVVEAVVRGNGLAEPHGSAVSPDGRYVYVSNNNTRGDYTPRYDFGDNAASGTVVVLDAATNTLVKVLEVEALPAGMDATR